MRPKQEHGDLANLAEHQRRAGVLRQPAARRCVEGADGGAQGRHGTRFDASDQMPSAVGSGSFWTGMVKYIQGGPSSLDGVLNDIEKSWPKS